MSRNLGHQHEVVKLICYLSEHVLKALYTGEVCFRLTKDQVLCVLVSCRYYPTPCVGYVCCLL